SVCNGVENLAVRHFAQAIVLKRNHGRKPVLLRDSIATSRSAVAHSARNVEPLLPALHQLPCNRQRNSCSPLVAHFAGIEVISSGTERDSHVRLLRRVFCHTARRAVGLRFWGSWIVIRSIAGRHFVTDRNRTSDRQTRTASIGKKIERCLCA